MALACLLCGCPQGRSGTDLGHSPLAGPPALRAIDLSDPIRPLPVDPPIRLQAAKNESTHFTLQISGVSAAHPYFVRFAAAQSPAGNPITPANIKTYQVLPVRVKVDPGFVRQTGLNTANRNVPRALLAAPLEGGVVSLAALRDPAQPGNSAAHPNGATVLLWADLHVPPGTPPGQYAANCEVTDATGHAIGAGVPIELTVYDFSLPDERHLQLVGRVNWKRLAALYPQWFGDTITPSLINRRDPRYAHTVATLDQLMALSHENRSSIVVPGLRPSVKWPAEGPPHIDWRELDALIAPWLNGNAFTDHMAVHDWPLPEAPSLGRYDIQSRLDYWSLAAAHFDQLGWLHDSPVELAARDGGAPTGAEAVALAAGAARILAVNPHVRVMLPLEDRQIDPHGAIKASDRERLLTAAPGLVSQARPPAIVAQVPAHGHWLRTGRPGALPYAAARDGQRDVRAWAWLAFLRQADLIQWDNTLPAVNGLARPSDAGAMVWFYPGAWFGVDHPVPTIQLKWLRRAEQDYEYLWLARERGEVINALQMARLLTKPVEVVAGQAADPAVALMSGTTSADAWDRAQELLAQTILLRTPGRPVDANQQRALYIQTLQWAEPRERPLLLPRSAQWSLQGPRKDRLDVPRGNWAALRLGLDIYNASDATPEHSLLRWAPPPPNSGWEINPEHPAQVPRLASYRLEPAALDASFDLSKLAAGTGAPLEANFIDGYTNRPVSHLAVRLPVAASDRREGPLTLDAKLNDWTDADAIQNGPMVLMLNRPDLQNQRLRHASVDAHVYSGWGAGNFYLAFALQGLAPDPHQSHNDVYYQARRAWGEDLCEALVQPIYSDKKAGPLLHVVFKPSGALWAEQKVRSDGAADEWQAMEGAGIRYATATTADGRWRGEAGIPWKLICGPGGAIPTLLRFNFCQHRMVNCESASWCGPVDFGRDADLMGLLYLRTPLELGTANAAR